MRNIAKHQMGVPIYERNDPTGLRAEVDMEVAYKKFYLSQSSKPELSQN